MREFEPYETGYFKLPTGQTLDYKDLLIRCEQQYKMTRSQYNLVKKNKSTGQACQVPFRKYTTARPRNSKYTLRDALRFETMTLEELALELDVPVKRAQAIRYYCRNIYDIKPTK